MRWIDRLSIAQRIVVVAALGLALAIVASYLTTLGTRSGWYAYAPLSRQLLQPQGFGEPGWVRLVIRLAATGLWALVSVALLRPAPATPARSPDRPNPIGLHRVKVVATDGPRIQVRPLEALNGTPVLDVKPVLDRTTER